MSCINRVRWGLTIIPLFFIGPLAAEVLQPQQIWKRHLIQEFSQDLCQPRGYMQRCLNLSQAQCRGIAERKLNLCLQQLPIPPQVNALAEGVELSFRAGVCAGKRIERELKSKASQTPQCQEVEPWL